MKLRASVSGCLQLSFFVLCHVPIARGNDVVTTFHADKLLQIDAAVSLAISDGRCPGGVLWIERGGTIYSKAYGDRAVDPAREAMTLDTIFDAASLTKVVATTPAVLTLVEQGKIELDAPVSRYLSEFTGAGKEAITVRQLLTHTSGLRAGLPLATPWTGFDRALALACAEPLPDPPGTIFRYSDINFILLGELVRKVSGQGLDAYCASKIFAPLKMSDTAFNPAPSVRVRIAPTERTIAATASARTEADDPPGAVADEARTILRGVVHDPTSRRMGGVAGHAGLFTTAADLARYGRMMLNDGELDGTRVLSAASVALLTSVQTPDAISARRGLGWDIDSAYAGPRGQWFPVGSYGHTGWTGTSLWIDPFTRALVILLSNRNHPTEAGNVGPLRYTVGTLAAEAIRGFNLLHVPGALPRQMASTSQRAPRRVQRQEVLSGIDVLVREKFAALRGLKVGLITNHTGIDRQRRSTIDLLDKAEVVELVALFSPEHGIRGVVDEKVPDSQDEKTGLPIYSLYGEKRAPTPEQLAGIDALVFDIQDIGCRFYTYISTLGECLVAAERAGKKFVVLDRPNPISGVRVEGPMLAAERSFTAWHELPVRHGMTVGELAKMFAAERAPAVDLKVVPCEGWKRAAWFDELGQPWTNPSPNMRTLTAAILYPGVGLLEFCNLSVGRGTDRPFEMLGAPYIDDRLLTAALNAIECPGIRFMPVRFTPKGSVFKDQECGGIQMILTSRDQFNPVEFGTVLASTLQRLYPSELKIERLSRLLAHPPTLDAIKAGKSLDAIKVLWAPERERFRERRARSLIYQ